MSEFFELLAVMMFTIVLFDGAFLVMLRTERVRIDSEAALQGGWGYSQMNSFFLIFTGANVLLMFTFYLLSLAL